MLNSPFFKLENKFRTLKTAYCRLKERQKTISRQEGKNMSILVGSEPDPKPALNVRIRIRTDQDPQHCFKLYNF
jgi:hypothetical protein